MTDPSTWTDAVLRNRQPLQPLPTEVDARLQPISGIRAVIFDIYGTLVISGSGDVGSAMARNRQDDLDAALEAVGLAPHRDALKIDDLHRQIRESNQSHRTVECPAPEVDIVEQWRSFLAASRVPDPGPETLVKLASEYESRANPTWPMPGAVEVLSSLNRLRTGIVSNAQEFTIPLVTELLIRANVSEASCPRDLAIFSYRFRQAKPGPRLFDVLRTALGRYGISTHEAIYVGNDMLNDVWAASQSGMRTAWFAGDSRSCRRREDDPRCRSLEPDLVLTALPQLTDSLGLN